MQALLPRRDLGLEARHGLVDQRRISQPALGRGSRGVTCPKNKQTNNKPRRGVAPVAAPDSVEQRRVVQAHGAHIVARGRLRLGQFGAERGGAEQRAASDRPTLERFGVELGHREPESLELGHCDGHSNRDGRRRWVDIPDGRRRWVDITRLSKRCVS